MTRRIANLLTALSLVLCVAVCATWVRSRWRGDHFTYTRGVDTHGDSRRDITEAGAVVEPGQLLLSWNAYRWESGFGRHFGEHDGWQWITWEVRRPSRAQPQDPGRRSWMGFGSQAYRQSQRGIAAAAAQSVA